jgi:hypothetical protein
MPLHQKKKAAVNAIQQHNRYRQFYKQMVPCLRLEIRYSGTILKNMFRLGMGFM